mmetsp:Transcript_21190/g.36408  ORF Transcript_21190/g.36408 Transcript_21190/m.36408 type:complete len:91 (-) Transcript_21190:276-548(-)
MIKFTKIIFHSTYPIMHQHQSTNQRIMARKSEAELEMEGDRQGSRCSTTFAAQRLGRSRELSTNCRRASRRGEHAPIRMEFGIQLPRLNE